MELILGLRRTRAAEPRLNFLWLLAEDTGPSAYSCYGEQKAAATPVIDMNQVQARKDRIQAGYVHDVFPYDASRRFAA